MSAPLPASSAVVAPSSSGRRIRGKTPPPSKLFLQRLDPEVADANQYVYLVTVSRLLPSTIAAGCRDPQTLSRKELCAIIRDSLENPDAGAAGGRPRTNPLLVEKCFVFQETHADGSKHFHAAVKISRNMRFTPAKATMRTRHLLPSHWSCSHSQMWSAVRYLYTPNPDKPRAKLDAKPLLWTHEDPAGKKVDLYEEAQRPFNAEAMRKRREMEEHDQNEADAKVARFTKLDFTCLVMSKELSTKNAVMEYVQEKGSAGMQAFVNQNQRKLVECVVLVCCAFVASKFRLSRYIVDAKEWANAKAMAAKERQSDWDLVCAAAAVPCPHATGECSYMKAATQIFARNAETLDPKRLAACLRDIIRFGPSKTCRIPHLVGPSNTGKSTLLYPFDDLFGVPQVFHKPAVGSPFGLRNIVGTKKRLIFWDDYRPVEFAHEKTVPVATFLSLFMGKDVEIQVSQSFNDGNPDVRWNRGVVFTSKVEGLWDATSRVSAEDIRHMRNRCELFAFTAVVTALKDVDPCPSCMARWITAYAAEWDAKALAPTPGMAPAAPSLGHSLVGFDAFVSPISLPGSTAQALMEDALRLGAAAVNEMTADDWSQCPAYRQLKPLEKRRFQAAVRALRADGA